MQEHCPHCGNFLIGPAHPVPDAPVVVGAFFASIVVALAGYSIGAPFVVALITGDVEPKGAGTYLLVTCIFVAITAGIFAIVRGRRAKKRDALARYRRCQSCGYQWDARTGHASGNPTR